VDWAEVFGDEVEEVESVVRVVSCVKSYTGAWKDSLVSSKAEVDCPYYDVVPSSMINSWSDELVLKRID
jgi:hypothetical protein